MPCHVISQVFLITQCGVSVIQKICRNHIRLENQLCPSKIQQHGYGGGHIKAGPQLVACVKDKLGRCYGALCLGLVR